MNHGTQKKWWMEAIVYQIYPQSFLDTNHDGYGDINGIIQKLDYIKDLGADAVWMSPVYASPFNDNGYDVSDYRDIHPRYGTLDDWKRLLEEAHRRDLRIVMDMVINHTSSEHRWFKDAKTSRTSPYRDYYIWREAKDGGYPNNWISYFNTPAWSWNDATEEYYLHLFDTSQPDLNWENPRVREEMCDIARFWMQLGVDGFRIDCANSISKTPGLPSSKKEVPVGAPRGTEYSANGPKVHDYLREFCHACYEINPDVLIVGECPFVDADMARSYVDFSESELSMVIQFELTPPVRWQVDTPSLLALAHHYERWGRLAGRGWHANYLSSHDQPRTVSRFGCDKNFRTESAKTLLLMNCSVFGTPFIFQGEEIAMTNVAFEDIADYRDVDTLNYYQLALKKGKSPEELMKLVHTLSRDNSRTPMQWNAKHNAGFSDAEPWIAVNPNYRTVNVEAAEQDKASPLYFFRQLAATRKKHPSLIYGSLTTKYLDETLWIFERHHEQETTTVLVYFGTEERDISERTPQGELLLSTHELQNLERLQAWESRVYLS